MDMRKENIAAARLRALIAPEPFLSTSEKLKLAIELCDAGIKMHRQTLKRNFPSLNESQIQKKLQKWLEASSDVELDAAELA